MFNLRFLWPVVQSIVADHFQAKIRLQEKNIKINLDVWQQSVIIKLFIAEDKVQVNWIEAGRWQGQVLTYEQVEQFINDLFTQPTSGPESTDSGNI